jgi:hypothetical protein
MSWLSAAVEHCPALNVAYLIVQAVDRVRKQSMLKTIVLIGAAAALVVPSVPAFAVSGNSSSYGSEGYGPSVPTQSLTPFQRSWNHANESKERARAGAAWIRHYGGYGPHRLNHHL